jgi:hypothetical protein
MENADCCVHGVQNRVRGRREFSSGKILGAFIVAKSDVNHDNLFLAVKSKKSVVTDKTVLGVVESKILANERKRLSSPFPSVLG